jgi:hypothetical protein
MSLSVSIRPFDLAKQTMRTFAETNQDASVVVTKALEIVDRWGPMKKFFCCCYRGEYFRQLDPAKSATRFRDGLEVILSSREFKSNNVALKDLCERACATFNRLIRETNKQAPRDRQVSDEKKLCVNLEEELRIASQEKKPVHRTKMVRADTAGEFTREAYDNLLGVIPRTH